MGLEKEIVKCDINGAEICRYKSVREASKKENISEDKIYKNISGRQKQADGFIFKQTGRLSNAVDKIGTGSYKCPYCEKRFKTYNGLAKHVIEFRKHGDKTQEGLLRDFKYNGKRPLCKCGCGQETSINPKNGYTFCDYIYGHGIRVHNNWGHNESAKAKSAETRRQQYLSGERGQWNKGKKWEDVYDEETIERLSKNLKEKLSKRIENGTFSIASKVEKDFIEKCVKPLGVIYKTQHFLKEINQFCDVFIPSKNLIIEFNGDFWHANPQIYKNGPQYEYQKIKIERDKIKEEYCQRSKINLLTVWETEFKENPEAVIEKIKSFSDII